MRACTFSGIAALMLLVILTGCVETLKASDALAIDRRMDVMATLSQMPAPRATLVFTMDPTFDGVYPDGGVAAVTNCTDWSITIYYHFAVAQLDFVIDKVLPHEYAHLMSCFYRGGMSEPDHGAAGDKHDAFWMKAVRKLGGDKDYV